MGVTLPVWDSKGRYLYVVCTTRNYITVTHSSSVNVKAGYI